MALLNKTFDLKTAAAMFGMGYIEFYKMLRGECQSIPLSPSWICSATTKGGTVKNAPKDWTRKAGYLTTEPRGRAASYNKNVAEVYHVTVLTGHGIMKLENILQKNALPPKPLALTAENAKAMQSQPTSHASQKERENLLREFNLPIYPAKAS